MPGHMIHLIVAKKVCPDAGIDFFVGNLAPDATALYANMERAKKDKIHFAGAPDMENALKDFALKADNDYLKGFLLHLYVDWKWNTTYLTDFASKNEGNSQAWYSAYDMENRKMTSFAFYDTEWAFELYEQMGNWDYIGFVDTEFITREVSKKWILSSKKWLYDNRLEPSAVFPPKLIEKFANDTADDFIKWFSRTI